MEHLLLAIILIFLLWDTLWWFLGIKPLFPWQLKARLGAGAADLVLLDVRTPLEYNWFHLPGAQNLPHFPPDSGELPPVSPSREVVVICMTGHRSPLVAYALKKKGYARVYNLTGGMVVWKMYEWVSQLRGDKGPPRTR
jgi:rhodanese-related sulfurtransferase